MRVYHLSHRISHAYVDAVGELKVSGLLGLFEQAAIEASADVGYDAERYQREGRVWIIRRTSLERGQPVGGTDTLEVQTQITDVRRARSLRRYDVRSNGVEVARGLTDWVYCDINSGRPSRVGADVLQALTEGDEVESLPRPADLPEAGSSTPVVLPIQVMPSHLDHITHVNNGVYADFLEDGAFALFADAGWSLEKMLAGGGALGLRRLDIEYYVDAKLGDQLSVSTWCDAGLQLGPALPQAAALIHVIRRGDGKELVRATTSWSWRQKSAVLGWAPALA
jgi:acyl-CoA thioesterase FadM